MLVAMLTFVGFIAFCYLCLTITDEEANLVDERFDKIIEIARFIWVYLSSFLLAVTALVCAALLFDKFSKYTEMLGLNSSIFSLLAGVLLALVWDYFKTKRLIHRLTYEEGFLELS